MTHPKTQHKLLQAQALRRLLLLPFVLMFSCSEPPLKPVPPLDLSKAIKKEVQEKPAAKSITKKGSVNRMPLGDLYQLVQNNAAVIYDVRPKFLYTIGHIPNAISWPEKRFLADIETHEPKIAAANSENTPVVIYCTDMACPDALNVANQLSKRGHTISILQGGYEAWKIAAD